MSHHTFRLANIQMYWNCLKWIVTHYARRNYLSAFHLCSLNTDPLQFKLKDKMLPHLSFNFLQSHMGSKEVAESHFCPFVLIKKGPFSKLMISIWKWLYKNVTSQTQSGEFIGSINSGLIYIDCIRSFVYVREIYEMKQPTSWQPTSRIKWCHDVLLGRGIMMLYLCTEMVTI